MQYREIQVISNAVDDSDIMMECPFKLRLQLTAPIRRRTPLLFGLILGLLASGMHPGNAQDTDPKNGTETTPATQPSNANPGAKKPDKPAAYDIYLKEGLVCRRCTAEPLPEWRVRLRDRNGRQTIVDATEIIGVDRHPLVRKWLVRSLKGIGNPGPIIVPYAFENGQDYVCKYCP